MQKELDTSSCMVIPGEILTVRLEQFQPETVARISFSPSDSVSSILLVQDVGVHPDGSFRILTPRLPVPPGTKIRIQIQGLNLANAFSGSLEVQTGALAVGLQESGHMDFFLFASHVFSQKGTITAFSADRMLFSPCGRYLVSGTRHETDGHNQGLPGTGETPGHITLVSPFLPAPILEEPVDGGISAIGFLPSGEPGSVQLLQSYKDDPSGSWHLAARSLDTREVGPQERIHGLGETSFLPRMIASAHGTAWISTDFIAAWLQNDPEPAPEAFVWIQPDRTTERITCGDLFDEEDTWHPFSVVAGNPADTGNSYAWWSCVRFIPDVEPRFEIQGAWFLTSTEGPLPESRINELSLASHQVPHDWFFGDLPHPDATGILTTICSEPDCEMHVISPDLPVFTLSLASMETHAAFPEILVQESRFIAYVPAGDSSPGIVRVNTIFGEKKHDEWNISSFGREIRHAVFLSEDLLLLAKSTQLVQSTAEDFRTGYQGTLMSPQVYKRISLSTGYR